jgi:hypothetical protein
MPVLAIILFLHTFGAGGIDSSVEYSRDYLKTGP